MSLSMGISIYAFFWETIKIDREYKKMFSQTRKSNIKKDVNVVLIVIDALRADHLGCYGYERQTSPHIDSLAKEGVLFKNCYAAASWTAPSLASIFTSLYPGIHRTTLFDSVLPDELTTIAEILQKEGYITYGGVAHPMLKRTNFNQGFGFFDDFFV